MARLYIDEDLANFVSPLRADGHDVLFAREKGAHRSDAWHLYQAAIERRVIITFNERDFRYFHRLWTSLRVFELMRTQQAGIVTATAQLEAKVWVPALHQLLIAEVELPGRMVVWHPSREEWREDRWRPEE